MESEGTEVIRILLVDDVEKIGSRSGLSSPPIPISKLWRGIDGEEAVLAVAQLKPSVVVMDINMPRLNGIEATAWIRRTFLMWWWSACPPLQPDTCQLMKAAGATTSSQRRWSNNSRM